MKLEYFKPTLDNLYKNTAPEAKYRQNIYLAVKWCDKLLKLSPVELKQLMPTSSYLKELKYLVAMSKQLEVDIDVIQEQLIVTQIIVNLEEALMLYNYEEAPLD